MEVWTGDCRFPPRKWWRGSTNGGSSSQSSVVTGSDCLWGVSDESWRQAGEGEEEKEKEEQTAEQIEGVSEGGRKTDGQTGAATAVSQSSVARAVILETTAENYNRV